MTTQTTLFDNIPVAAPPTEGIKYAGSKLRLLPEILRLAGKVNAKTVLDGFSGTTRVSQAFAQTGHGVICNDHAVWSEFFGTCFLLGSVPSDYQSLIDHLNAVAPRDGWFTEHYGASPERSASATGAKRPWQLHNTRKLDGIRDEIDLLSLDKVEKAVALTSLILALDRVDSTLGHFVSYLRDWSPRSYNTLHLRVPAIVGRGAEHQVLRKDVFDVASQADVDLAYFDPPYGSNNEKMPPSRVRYSAYYHIWTTICLNDRPDLFGKVGRRRDSSDTVSSSRFEDFRRDESGRFVCVNALAELLASTRAPHILLSYSSGGRATAEELNSVIEASGSVIEMLDIDYKRNVMASMRWTNEWLRDADTPNREFLFLIARR